jgi:hypothetical protein
MMTGQRGKGVGADKWTGEQRWVAALAIAVLLVLVATIGLPLGPVRVVAGVLTTFFAPGYALTLIIRPRQLAAISRVVLSVPLSLAVAIGWGIVLGRLPSGVHPNNLAFVTALTTLGLFLVAAYLHRREVPGFLAVTRKSWSTPRQVQLPGVGRTAPLPRPALLAGIALVVILAWAGVGLVRGSREVPARYTEFFLIDAKPDGTNAAIIRLGVRNMEGSTRRYLVRVSRGPNPDRPDAGTPVPPAGGTNTLVVDRDLTVADNAEGDIEVRLNLSCGDSVEARLWLAESGAGGTPYRTVRVRPDCGPASEVGTGVADRVGGRRTPFRLPPIA